MAHPFAIMIAHGLAHMKRALLRLAVSNDPSGFGYRLIDGIADDQTLLRSYEHRHKKVELWDCPRFGSPTEDALLQIRARRRSHRPAHPRLSPRMPSPRYWTVH